MKKLSNALRAVFLGLSMATFVTVPVALTGCQFLGVQQPQSFDERIVAAYKSAEGAADSILAVFRAGKISKEDANAALDRVQEGNASIEVASRLHASGDFSSADTRLAAAIAALEILKAEMGAK